MPDGPAKKPGALLGVIKRKRLTNSTEVSPLTTRNLRYATGLLPHPPKHERRHAVLQRHCHFHLHQRRNRPQQQQQQYCEFFGTIFQLNNKPLFYSYSDFVFVLLGKLLARNTYCLQTLFYTCDTSRKYNPTTWTHCQSLIHWQRNLWKHSQSVIKQCLHKQALYCFNFAGHIPNLALVYHIWSIIVLYCGKPHYRLNICFGKCMWPTYVCPIDCDCRIHWLHVCRGVRLPNECPGYDTKQSDGEIPVMLELWGMRSTPSLP